MDLNGTIVTHEVLEAAPRYTPAYGAGTSQVVDTFCGPLFDPFHGLKYRSWVSTLRISGGPMISHSP